MVRATLHAVKKNLLAQRRDTVSADASNKVAALDAYANSISNQVADFVTKSESEIAALQTQITKKRHGINVQQQQKKLHADVSHRICAPQRSEDILRV